MSTLDQRVIILCPLAQAAARLRQFFHGNGNAEPDTVRLVLHANVDIPGVSTPGGLERAVIATIQPRHLAADMTPRYSVQWAPETPGPFPLFAGELFVDCGDDYDTFRLRLSGEYKPPLGLLGKGFDAVVGRRIAQATASDLLRRIKDLVERQFAADEERKRLVRQSQLDAS